MHIRQIAGQPTNLRPQSVLRKARFIMQLLSTISPSIDCSFRRSIPQAVPEALSINANRRPRRWWWLEKPD